VIILSQFNNFGANLLIVAPATTALSKERKESTLGIIFGDQKKKISPDHKKKFESEQIS
jgi:hypothetical protein